MVVDGGSLTAISQDMEGNVIWDSISELDFYMTEGSTLKGAFVDDESDAGNGGSGYANVPASLAAGQIIRQKSLRSFHKELIGTMKCRNG
ncbi:MAG: hypothetical protein J6I76_11195 [Oribacterium sp.]|nr:hypothetical protein [Oribacterium sp.]MBP3804441.1 hypothetical protein [Oribacterium sp.]